MALLTANTILKYGIKQMETATVVGTITDSGDATVIITGTGITGSPVTLSVAVTEGDTAKTVANKIKNEILLDANITAKYDVSVNKENIILRAVSPIANVSNLNVSIDNDTCTGLTTANTSESTLAGVAYTKLIDILNYPDLGAAPSKIDTTTLTEVDMKINMEGLQETSDITFEAMYTDGDYENLLLLENTPCSFQILFGADDGDFRWDGELSVYVVGGTVDEARKMMLSLSVETEIESY